MYIYVYIVSKYICMCVCNCIKYSNEKNVKRASVFVFHQTKLAGKAWKPEPGRPYRLSMPSDREFWTVMHLDRGEQVKPKADNQKLLSQIYEYICICPQRECYKCESAHKPPSICLSIRYASADIICICPQRECQKCESAHKPPSICLSIRYTKSASADNVSARNANLPTNHPLYVYQ